MMIRAASIFLVLAFTACETGPRTRLKLPTGPTVIYVPPPPVPFAPLVFTPLEVGAVFQGRVDNPQQCIDDLGWPCLYFRLTVPISGTLSVSLTSPRGIRVPADLTVRVVDGGAYTWAQLFSETETRVTAPVVAGRSYDVTMWYVNTGVEFELRPSVQ